MANRVFIDLKFEYTRGAIIDSNIFIFEIRKIPPNLLTFLVAILIICMKKTRIKYSLSLKI